MKTFTDHMKELIERREAAEERDPIWKFAGNKIAIRGLAWAVDVNLPELWGLFGAEWCEEPPWSGCVIKPTSASNSRGVLPLERRARGWRSMMGDGIRSWKEWRQWSLAERARHEELDVEPYGDEWLCEELVTRRGVSGARLLPYDWKCYCLGGRVAWINQIDKTSSRNARSYRTRHWWRMPEGLIPAAKRIIEQPREAAHLPRPRKEEDLLRTADRVSSALLERTDSLFVRVDLYECDHRGIVLGEITPHPSGGNEVYEPAADRILGRLWSNLEDLIR